ncbi:MAG: methyltransferase domain-containing protein [Myxococcota bacterium]
MSNTAYDFSRVLAYYREFLQHDEDARKVSWRARYDQELRFEQLLEVVDDSLTHYTLLDLGCGLGDLRQYLLHTGRTNVHYVGVDIVPEMIAAAQARDPEGTYHCCNILDDKDRTLANARFDVVLCSGALTVRVPNHDQFVHAMLDRMVALADKAVAVNLLSDRYFRVMPTARHDPDLYYADATELYRHCRDRVRWAVLREDIFMSDFTLYLYPGYARTIERYRQLLDDPVDPFGLAWLLLERRLPSQALEVLGQIDDPTADTLNLEGVAHQQLGDRRMARRLYKRALVADPNYEPARLNLENVS